MSFRRNDSSTAFGLLGHAGLAAVELVEGGHDGIAHLASGGGAYRLAGVPGGFDGLLQVGV
jgi:hypothetical protein